MSNFIIQIPNKVLHFKHNVTVSPPCTLVVNHMHPGYEILYFVSGDATLIIEDKQFYIRPGDLIIIPPMHYHYLQINSPSNYERYNVIFTLEDLGIVNDAIIPKIPIVNITSNHIAVEIFKKMDYYYSTLNLENFIEVSKLLVRELFYALSAVGQSNENDFASVLNPLLSDALAYIKQNLYTLSGMSEIANKLFVSESYLFYLFKTYVKTTPKRYITEKRLLAAKGLINQGVKPTKAYEQVGFNDYTSFYRNYTKFFGYPPSSEHDEDKQAKIVFYNS